MNEQRKSVHEQRKAVNAQRKAVVRQCVRLRAVGGWTIAATATAAAVLQLCLRLRHGGGLRLHVVCSGEGCCGCGSNELCDFELSIYNQMMIAPDLISNAETGTTAAPPTKKLGAPSVAAASMGARAAFYSSDWHVSATTSCAPEIFRWTIMHRKVEGQRRLSGRQDRPGGDSALQLLQKPEGEISSGERYGGRW